MGALPIPPFSPVPRSPWTPRALATIGGLVALVITSLASADTPWPTPPPAPAAPFPSIESNIAPVAVPQVAGAAFSVVQPLPQLSIPAIPPLLNTTFEAPGHLTVIIEAGSLDRTIQLTYAPVPVDQVLQPGRLQRLVRAFDLKSYDHRGREFQPELSRPWIMQVPVSRLPGPFGDPARLIFVTLEEGRWVPLVTSYYRDNNVLVARILKGGRFAILAELRPT